jgi:hypothetical protein
MFVAAHKFPTLPMLSIHTNTPHLSCSSTSPRLPVFVQITKDFTLHVREHHSSTLLSLHSQLVQHHNALLGLKTLHEHHLSQLEQERLATRPIPLTSTELGVNRVKAIRSALILKKADGVQKWIGGWMDMLMEELEGFDVMLWEGEAKAGWKRGTDEWEKHVQQVRTIVTRFTMEHPVV